MTKTKIVLDPDADYTAKNIVELCELMIEEIHIFRKEKETLDINDSFGDYLEGLISAREVTLGRLGVSLSLYMEDC